MLFQLNSSSSMIINRARLTSAAGETRDRVNDTNARRSSLVRLKTDCMLHIVLLKSMLRNTRSLLKNCNPSSTGCTNGKLNSLHHPTARREPRRWANGKLSSSRVAPSLNLRPGVFQNIQPAFDSVSHVDQLIGIDVQIVEHRRLLAFRWRRNEEAHLLRTELVSEDRKSTRLNSSHVAIS